MPYLTGNQRTRAYGSYNSKNNTFMLNTINNGSCWIPRQARCQAPCGAFYPDKKANETPEEYLEKYEGWVQERKNAIKNGDNKRIIGTVRVPSSEYQMNKASGVSTQSILFNRLQPKTGFGRNDLDLLQWNQSSDRAFPSRFNKMMKVNVPSHGNSTKTSLTRHRPGAGAGGKQDGVDLKHNSYHRYLLKKKGLKPLRGASKAETIVKDSPSSPLTVFDKSIQNNKWKKDSIIANMNFCLYDEVYECKPLPKPVPKPTLADMPKPDDESVPSSLLPNKELSEEVEPKKSPADFFNINKFDYTIKHDNIERIKDYREVQMILTDLYNIEEFFVNSNPYICYVDKKNEETKLFLKDIDNAILKIRNPCSFKFRSKIANFDASYENNEWFCNPPISKQDRDIFIFDVLQNFTLVARIK